MGGYLETGRLANNGCTKAGAVDKVVSPSGGSLKSLSQQQPHQNRAYQDNRDTQ